jgi:predicted permease
LLRNLIYIATFFLNFFCYEVIVKPGCVHLLLNTTVSLHCLRHAPVDGRKNVERLWFAPIDDDVFYLFLQKQKIGAELHVYLEEGTYHKRLFRGPNTNDMKK